VSDNVDRIRERQDAIAIDRYWGDADPPEADDYEEPDYEDPPPLTAYQQACLDAQRERDTLLCMRPAAQLHMLRLWLEQASGGDIREALVNGLEHVPGDELRELLVDVVCGTGPQSAFIGRVQGVLALGAWRFIDQDIEEQK
jgi:hypothetical protein